MERQQMERQDVTVYNTEGSFINDLGTPVMPASIKPVDFTALDKAIALERDLSQKAVDVAMDNVKEIGAIQDELTKIQTPTAYHQLAIEDAKKQNGINQQAMSQAANNIDNPMALYDMHRKQARLLADPRVKDAMYDAAVLENYKKNLPAITDPALRAIAISDLKSIETSKDPNAIKSLNLDQYKTVDLEKAYEAALDHYAPYQQTQEQVKGPNGETYTQTVMKRDPEMVAKTRDYFMRDANARNNLVAKGYIDVNGKPAVVQGEKTWFDDIENANSQEMSQITNVKGASGGSGGGGNYSYQVPSDFQGISYKPDVVEDKDLGTSFDAGVISMVETGGRAPQNVVHKDAGVGGNLNVGAYSFNGQNATKFVTYLDGATDAESPGAQIYIDALKEINFEDGSDANLAKAKKAYDALEKALPPGKLKQYETMHAIDKFGKPVIEEILGHDPERTFTTGEATLLMDTGIQWKDSTWKKWITEYFKDESGLSLMDFITKKRIAEATGNANKGLYPGGVATADSLNNRALKVLEAAMRIDGASSGAATGAQSQSGGTPSNTFDPTQYNSDIDPGMAAAIDSTSASSSKEVANNWLN